MSGRYKPRGWFGEPHRHYLAAKGIKTKHNYFADNDLSEYMRKRRQKEQMLAERFGDEDLASDFNSDKFDAVLSLRGFKPLAWTPQVRALVYNPQEGVMIEYTEGDYRVYEDPSEEKIGQVLQQYPKGEVSLGERYDPRFSEMSRQRELNAQSLAQGLTDDEERFI